MKQPIGWKLLKPTLWAIFVIFLLLNVIAAMQAYKFTHYSKSGVKTDSLKLTTGKKLQLLISGVDNPRPVNEHLPTQPYTTVTIKSNVTIECWSISTPATARGTVVLLHGYTACKSLLIDRAEPFLKAGYNCLLVDFIGSGGSGGNSTTIGYAEAEEVKDCYNYLHDKGEQHIYLYGSSMGAVSIMKAINDYNIKPDAIIIECPFATMYETIAIRFRNLGIPEFPMAGILLFWGGLENGFWGFGHNPVQYAAKIKCPTLLQYGTHDDRVARNEIDRIFAVLQCPKKLVVYPNAGHDNYLQKDGVMWQNETVGFLDMVSGKTMK